VITVALGSTLATILLSEQVSPVEGTAALALLAGAQFVVAWLVVRRASAGRAVTSRPSLLLRNGSMPAEVMPGERVTRGEVLQAVRSEGIGDLDEVAAVVLETNCGFSVVPRTGPGNGSALVDVAPRYEQVAAR
jgi:uncharacterized membrane protein YcaP (DUF421 family)